MRQCRRDNTRIFRSPALLAPSTMQPLRNNADRLLALGRNAYLRRILASVGFNLPVDLDRGSACWFERPLVRQLRVDTLKVGDVDKSILGNGITGDLNGVAQASALIVDCTASDDVDARDLFALLRDARSKNYSRTTLVFRVGSSETSQAAAAGVGGLVRSLAKEVGSRGGTVNGVCVHGTAPRAAVHAASYLSLPEAAFVTGQVVHVGRGGSTDAGSHSALLPLGQASLSGGRYALVTGAARGIGLAIARRLAREGATIIGVDIPAASDSLSEAMASVGGVAIPLDIGAPGAAARLVAAVRARAPHVHVLVHNAGITRDKTLRRMSSAAVDDVLRVNLEAPLSLTRELRSAGLIGGTGDTPTDRVICISSISGIGGAFGQTNYGYSKAGLIGWVLLGLRCREAGTAQCDSPPLCTLQLRQVDVGRCRGCCGGRLLLRSRARLHRDGHGGGYAVARPGGGAPAQCAAAGRPARGRHLRRRLLRPPRRRGLGGGRPACLRRAHAGEVRGRAGGAITRHARPLLALFY